MNIKESTVYELEQASGLYGIHKIIEIAGRTCYKSDNNMTDTSGDAFVKRLIDNGHGAMLEHGTVYLKLKWWQFRKIVRYFFAPYTESNKLLYVTTNYRVIIEHKWQDDLELLCEPTKYHAKRRTFKFICDIGVSREANRHRVNSIAEQSTRLCNYAKDKFGNEISIIKPDELGENIPSHYKQVLRNFMGYARVDSPEITPLDYWYAANAVAEYCYMSLIEKCGWKPQQARRILPLDTQTELVHTAFEHDWDHFLKLRCAPNAHPDMQKVAFQVRELLNSK